MRKDVQGKGQFLVQLVTDIVYMLWAHPELMQQRIWKNL